MGFGVVGEVVLGGDGDVRSGIILLPVEGFAAEQSLNCWKEAILKQLTVYLSVDVAVHDERTDEAPPGYSSINIENVKKRA